MPKYKKVFKKMSEREIIMNRFVETFLIPKSEAMVKKEMNL